jgi:hypothetical protein
VRQDCVFTVLVAGISPVAANADDALNRSPELQLLDRFVGTWDHEVTIKTPEGETKGNRVDTRNWSPGGNFLIFENSIDSKANSDIPELYFILTYDAYAKRYPECGMNGSYRGLITGTCIRSKAARERIADRSQRTSQAIEAASLALGQATNSLRSFRPLRRNAVF